MVCDVNLGVRTNAEFRCCPDLFYTTHTSARRHARTHAHTQSQTHTHTHTYTHAHTHAPTHPCTRTPTAAEFSMPEGVVLMG